MIPFAEYFHELMTVVLRSSETKEVGRSYTIYLYRGVCVGPEMSYERKISPGFTLKDCRNCETKVVWFFACPDVHQYTRPSTSDKVFTNLCCHGDENRQNLRG